ncbi:DUF4375 domain-containing protein [Bremerella sp.]|uniref:DMP19 family protein n=1 Tax=Bremerella sp. TaxID=2795602 RepID=UPI00391A6FE8
MTYDWESLLRRLYDIAIEKLSDVDDDFSKVEEPFQTIGIIYSAQGVIDNGGLIFFFQHDWDGQPPYSLFADAYDRIGRPEAAQAIRDAADSFGLDHPERDGAARRDYINHHYNPAEYEVDGWNDCLCGDELVWTNLEKWVRSFEWW